MLHHDLVKIRQHELQAEADRERLVRAARAARSESRPTLDRRPSITARLRDLGRQLRRRRPAADDRAGAI